ncbi:major head protein [Salmonella phage FSL SP-058]|uniref:Major coat protein n=1 Tax=Salmonella phage FSL SP-058 TaxID=1173761 RepID=S4TSV3_9CAUD|nr:major head protein [Salmonella phage FSL SP-058]AGF88180.1 major coat protein [Salmonella phage FSL SP-058]WDR22570.1 cell division protein [Salmonella phage vB_SenP_UTK0002]
MKYNAPNTTPSSIGPQIRLDYYYKKALVDAAKEMYFGQLAEVTNMPKNMGKQIKLYHYVPLLDDRNVNDQGIDAAGATIANGNLYGSSKDIGTIPSKLPALTENGGRVNRVGFTRIQLVGSIKKFGFFYEWTQEAMDFDTDEELDSHLIQEAVKGANEITEDQLQIDLLNGAGVVRYPGSATSNADMTGEGTATVVTYEGLVKMGITLNDNLCPMQTKLIAGSLMTDTRTIQGARALYIGSELELQLRKMQDPFGNAAFIPVQQYADAGNLLKGEIGSIASFRVIVVPKMLKWAGAGATVTTNPGYYATSGKYDVFPMLCVGSGSFTTIGFQTDGKTVKFTTYTKKPGIETVSYADPYGEMGLTSIKWYYGSLILRPEWIALFKTVAAM